MKILDDSRLQIQLVRVVHGGVEPKLLMPVHVDFVDVPQNGATARCRVQGSGDPCQMVVKEKSVQGRRQYNVTGTKCFEIDDVGIDVKLKQGEFAF